MKTTFRHLLRCAPGLLLAAGAHAQSAAPADAPAPRIERRLALISAQEAQAIAAVDAQQIAADAQMVAHDAERAAHEAMQAQGDMAFIHSELAQSRVTKGAPYCADAVHETIQPLADGNRIVRSQSTRMCRDGEGRTRQEVERDGHRVVYLRDPVAKESWVLDADKKTARKFGGAGAGIDSAAWQVYADQMREWAQKVKAQVRERVSADGTPPAAPAVAPQAPVPPVPPTPVVLSQSDRTTKDAQGRERREVRIEVLRVDAPHPMAPMAPMAPMHGPLPPLPDVQAPPAVMARAMVFAPRGPGAQSTLGSKEIEGVKANGERTTWTIEAGKVGNEKPIVITRDVWTSPDLMLTIASRNFDPRSGESNYRLQNLKRGEPDAALMKVPTDYTQTRPEKRELVIERKVKKG